MTITISLKTPSFTVEGPSSGTSVSIGDTGTEVNVPPLEIAVDYGTILSQEEFIPTIPVRKIREVTFWGESLELTKQLGLSYTDLDIRSEELVLVKDMYLTLSDNQFAVENFSRDSSFNVSISSIANNLDSMTYIRMSRLDDINEARNPVEENVVFGASIIRALDDISTCLDAGLLRVASYADPTYFAEDYVEDYRITFN